MLRNVMCKSHAIVKNEIAIQKQPE